MNLLRPSIREQNRVGEKKKIFFKTKKNLDILQRESDEENDKENQNDENARRKTTVRGSNPSKRSASEKIDDPEASPAKRAKKNPEDLDKPLPVISPTPIGRKKSDEETRSVSLRFTRETSSTQTKLVVAPPKSSTDVRNDKGESLLHQAVKKGDVKRVQQLIDDGLSVNTSDHNGWTPLHEVKTREKTRENDEVRIFRLVRQRIGR